MTTKEEKEKQAIIGELVINVAALSKEEAQRISDIVFGMKLLKELEKKGA